MGLLRNLLTKSRAGDSAGPRRRSEIGQHDSPLPPERLAEIASHNANGRYAEAYALVSDALRVEPRNLELGFARASILLRWGRPREALAVYLDVESSGLAHPTLYRQLAMACIQTGSLSVAEGWSRKAIATDPLLGDAHFLLGTVLQAQKRFSEAIASYDIALLLKPDDFDSLVNLGCCHLADNQPQRAESCARRAIAACPARAIAWTNLGVALDEQDRHAEALEALEQGYRLDAEGVQESDIVFNLAIGLKNAGRVDDAIGLYERTLPLRPVLKGYYGYGEALLTAGRLEEGFANYAFRSMWGPHLSMRQTLARPVWSGQDLRGKRIMLIAEQGLGDTFQFVRYAGPLKALGATVLVRARDPLRDLIETVSGADEVSYDGEPVPDFDYYLYMMSAPCALGTRLDTIPSKIPYLSAQADRVKRWSKRLAADGSPKIGLVWAGNPEHLRDRHRSIPPRALEPLRTVQGVRLVSLQKIPGGKEATALPALDLVNLGPELRDFADTAAVISLLDLVVCVDTAVAHLAGALGKDVWLLLPEPAEWRWLLKREDSPWYPTMRLFRQQRSGDWNGVIERVRHDLQAELQDGSLSGAQAAQEALKQSSFLHDAMPPEIPVSVCETRSGYAAVAETDLGIVEYFPDDTAVGRSIRWYGEYLRPQLDILAHLLTPGMVVVEAGAGPAYHALLLSRAIGTAGHLMLFEPRPAMHWVVRENVAANGLANVTLMQGIGPRDQSAGRSPSPTAPWVESLDELRLERLHWMKVGEHADAMGVIDGSRETLWNLRPSLFISLPRAQALAATAERTREFSYRCWRLETPLFNQGNFNRQERDVFEGRSAVALIAIPEESKLDLTSFGCIELE